jgi:hypothetical protein
MSTARNAANSSVALEGIQGPALLRVVPFRPTTASTPRSDRPRQKDPGPAWQTLSARADSIGLMRDGILWESPERAIKGGSQLGQQRLLVDHRKDSARLFVPSAA